MRTLRRIIAFALTLVSLAGATSAQFQGFVDVLDPFVVGGWACGGGQSVWVHVYDGPTYLGSTTSNTGLRPDAASSCSGNGWVGWAWALPAMAPGQHTIKVYASHSPAPSMQSQLPGSTNLFVPSANFGGNNPFGVLESSSSTQVSGWACDLNTTAQLQLEVWIQLDGVGPQTLLATGANGLPRPDVPFGNGLTGFAITLPPVRGGNHNVVVRAKNVGAGQDNLLERFSALPALTSFPYAPSFNADPGLTYGTSCWQGTGGWTELGGCANPGQSIWFYSISDTVQTSGVPQPQPGYLGPPARLRYDGLAGGGTVWKINTRDVIPDVYPWDYNFQAIQTQIPPIALQSVDSLKLEVRLGTRPDFFFYDPSLTGPPPGIDTGNDPWVHQIVAAVFGRLDGTQTYFLEIVPFVRENQVPSTLGGVGGPPNTWNARIAVDDPRLAGAINLPTRMLLGEERTLVIDLEAAFHGIWPEVAQSSLWYTGSYMGTEQYGREQIALNFRRLSVQPTYTHPTLQAIAPDEIPAGGSSFDLHCFGTGFGAQSTIEWNGQSLPGYLAVDGHVWTTIPAGLIAATGSASVRVVNPAPAGGATNVLPIVILPSSPGSSFCFGTAATCPCGNVGTAGHGCAHSGPLSHGGRLDATGTTQPDTVELFATDLLPGALCIVLQGDATGAGVPFGDGVRCALGHILRLASRTASLAMIHYPETGAPSLTQQSAALGDVIVPGDRRYYQVYFRDPAPGFCPPPSGGTWNVTNATSIEW